MEKNIFLKNELLKNFNLNHKDTLNKIETIFNNIKNKQRIGQNTLKNEIKKYFIGSYKINQILYWVKRGWSEEEAIKKIKHSQKGRTKNQIEYWLKKGYSQENAKMEITKFQSEQSLKGVKNESHKGKFSKIWFQKKYGDNWEQKYIDHNNKKTKKIKKENLTNDEWQLLVEKKKKTYYSKSDEERELINEKRTKKIRNYNPPRTLDEYIHHFGDIGYETWLEKNKNISIALKNTSSFRNISIQEKAKATIIKKYGSTSACQNKKIKEKLKNTLSITYYKKLLKKLTKIKPLFQINEYTTIHNDYSWVCLKCNLIFTGHLKYGEPCCPICEPKNTSKGEYELRDFIINELNLNVETNNRTILNGKELDIYLPTLNMAIEYNGIYWHSELNGKNQNYHLNKTINCEKQKIQLLHIFETEWNLKQEIVKSILKSKTNKIENKIFARKCSLSVIDTKTKNDFLNTNHIQGEDNSSIKLGLIYNNNLVSVITFTRNKNKNKIYEWELSRFASLLNHTVIGGFSKLLKYFINNYKPISIGSYADLRFSNGDVYRKNKFTEYNRNKPTYWYFTSSSKLFHRQNFQKNNISKKLEFYNEELTEWENMQLNGFDRIWDSGNILFILNEQDIKFFIN